MKRMKRREMLKMLFTSNTRLKLLDHFFNHPFRSFYLRELQRTLDESLTPLRRELGKMEQIGLLQSRREGNQKYYALNREFIIYPELQNIFTKMRYTAGTKNGASAAKLAK
jgi:predicted transcriptional regulator